MSTTSEPTPIENAAREMLAVIEPAAALLGLSGDRLQRWRIAVRGWDWPPPRIAESLKRAAEAPPATEPSV